MYIYKRGGEGLAGAEGLSVDVESGDDGGGHANGKSTAAAAALKGCVRNTRALGVFVHRQRGDIASQRVGRREPHAFAVAVAQGRRGGSRDGEERDREQQ